MLKVAENAENRCAIWRRYGYITSKKVANEEVEIVGLTERGRRNSPFFVYTIMRRLYPHAHHENIVYLLKVFPIRCNELIKFRPLFFHRITLHGQKQFLKPFPG